jgi:hypothetical protein
VRTETTRNLLTSLSVAGALVGYALLSQASAETESQRNARIAKSDLEKAATALMYRPGYSSYAISGDSVTPLYYDVARRCVDPLEAIILISDAETRFRDQERRAVLTALRKDLETKLDTPCEDSDAFSPEVKQLSRIRKTVGFEL